MTLRIRNAFTLVELMVVMTILLLLIMLLLPTFSTAKESARRSVCQANLHSVSQAYTNRRADENPPNRKATLSINEWKVALMPYVSNNNGAFVCPDDENYDGKMTQTVVDTPPVSNIPPGTYTGSTQSGLYALRDYNGGNFICDMPMEEGPLCKRLTPAECGISNAPAGSYILSFEDQRNSDNTVASTDWSYHNPDMLVTPNSNGTTTISVAGGGGGYRWDLVSPSGQMLIGDILKSDGGKIGTAVTVQGGIEHPAGAAGGVGTTGTTITYTNYGCSYGLNFLLPLPGNKKVLAMDFPTPIIHIANPSAGVDDNSMWHSGAYIFARHFAKANVLFADGAVDSFDPAALDPIMIDSADFDSLWKP